MTVVGTDAAYMDLIRNQGSPGLPGDPAVLVPVFVAFYLVAVALLLALSLASASPLMNARPALRAAASGGLLAMGLAAAFSIGVPLLIAGMLAVAATILSLRARSTLRTWVSVAVAATIALVVLAVGFQVSWNYIQCPATGQSSGTTPGFFGASSYTCNGGRLTVASQ